MGGWMWQDILPYVFVEAQEIILVDSGASESLV